MMGNDDIQRLYGTRAQTQAFYNRLSGYYEWLASPFESGPRNRALGLANIQPGEWVLEVGPGPGRMLERMAYRVGLDGRVVGLDLSPGMLKVAARRLARAGIRRRADLVNGDAALLPFAEGSFDVVFSTFTLELIDTPEIPTVLAEVKRVLKEGGRFIDLSLSRESPGWATTLYEWLHVRFPRLLDCRPIYARRAIAGAGFIVEETQWISVARIGAEVVLARKTEEPTSPREEG